MAQVEALRTARGYTEGDFLYSHHGYSGGKPVYAEFRNAAGDNINIGVSTLDSMVDRWNSLGFSVTPEQARYAITCEAHGKDSIFSCEKK